MCQNFLTSTKRRFFQLQSLITYYLPGFDDRKIWFYGCNCLMETDKPMASQGRGKPTDRLDRLCQKWKACQRCSRSNYGDNCMGEIQEYEIYYRGDDLSCKINGNSNCQRSLCECDLEFARELPNHIDSYSDDFHVYWSSPEIKWKPEQDCVKDPSPPKMGCCGGRNEPFFTINSEQKDCCADGSTAPKGQCPDYYQEITTTEQTTTTEWTMTSTTTSTTTSTSTTSSTTTSTKY